VTRGASIATTAGQNPFNGPMGGVARRPAWANDFVLNPQLNAEIEPSEA